MKFNRETVSTSETTLGLGVQVARVDLSSAQLLSLHSSPAMLVPAPGLGKVILLINLIAKLHFGSTPYTMNGSMPGPDLYYGTFNSRTIGGWTGPAQDHTTEYHNGWGWDGQQPPDVLDNQSLNLSIDAEMTGGDGTATLWLYYIVQDVS